MNFERATRRTIRSLPLVPMIDVMFILIIFFMLTTSFMRIESLELLLPSVTTRVAQKDDTLRLFIKPDGRMILGERNVTPEDLSASLSRLFSENPAAHIMLL
ncbi:MAG: biopolymer transporter ExbD, partial [Pseudomonadota bacterium]|nr:biopolymer transporter ExbD [Pseudomonadota bacterium]